MQNKAMRKNGGQHGLPPARFSFESVASHSAKYRSDIDGLRAVAVIAVLLYHLGIGTVHSGYMGVDIFYVISGYLITSLISKELAADRFSILAFYERRTRRIFPALLTVLFFCVLAVSVLFDPEQLAKFGKSLLATTFFVSNLYFWHSAQLAGYFDTSAAVQPLLHTWSLAVEEQFYLLFPLTLYMLFRWARKWINAYLLFFCAASFAFNLWTTHHKPVFAFYWLAPRAWELLCGALLAMKAFPLIRSRILTEILALLGMALILTAVCSRFRGLPFPGYVALLPCIGTALVIYAGESQPSLVSRALSLKPVVFIGVISYSLYLWHWPVIVFTERSPLDLSKNSQIAFVLLFSTLAAFLSFEFIERPFRGNSSRFGRRQVFALGLAASILTALCGTIAFKTHGLPQRYDARTLTLIDRNRDRAVDFNGSCSNWRTEVRSISDIKFCKLGEQSPHKILFWGDSHVEQLYPAIQDLYSRGELKDRGVLLAIESGCFPDRHLNTADNGYHCDSFARFAEQRARWRDIDLVFIGFSTKLANRDDTTCVSMDEKCLVILSRVALERRLLEDLAEEIRLLKSDGKAVVVSLPFPIYDKRIPDVEITNAILSKFRIQIKPRDVTSPILREQIRAVAINAGADVFDPELALCQKGFCITEISGVSLYKDDSHLAASQVNILEDSLRAVLQHSLVVHAASFPATSPPR